jgi:hypothetical protein
MHRQIHNFRLNLNPNLYLSTRRSQLPRSHAKPQNRQPLLRTNRVLHNRRPSERSEHREQRSEQSEHEHREPKQRPALKPKAKPSQTARRLPITPLLPPTRSPNRSLRLRLQLGSDAFAESVETAAGFVAGQSGAAELWGWAVVCEWGWVYGALSTLI